MRETGDGAISAMSLFATNRGAAPGVASRTVEALSSRSTDVSVSPLLSVMK